MLVAKVTLDNCYLMNKDSDQLTKIDFLDRYWEILANHGWISLILHDWQRIPHNVVSDIDYVVSGPDPRDLVRVLHEYCQESGWKLVQILEHEVNSLCCICFQQEAPFESVSLDVTWDYRRKGIDLISNSVLVEGAWQPQGKAFHVPAPKVEFLYRLIKAAAKSKVLKNQEDLVDSLYEIHREDPEGVDLLLKEHSGETIGAQNDRQSFLKRVNEVLAGRYFSAIESGRAYGFKEIARRIRRGIQPTGMLVGYQGKVSSGVRDESFEILREAFRRFEVEEKSGGFFGDWMARRRSVFMLREKRSNGGEDLLATGTCAHDIVSEVLLYLAERLRGRWNL